MTTNSINRIAPDSALSLRCPDAVIAAIPYLLGFQPSESLVIVWLSKNQVLLTLRVDLPPEAYSGDHMELSQTLAGAATNTAADAIIICVFTAATSDGQLPNTSLITKLMVDFYRLGVGVRDALLVRHRAEIGSAGAGGSDECVRWWSYLGDDEGDATPGRVLDEQVSLYVRSRFALEGIAALPGRVDLEHSLDPDTGRGPRVDSLITEITKDLTKSLDDFKRAGSKAVSGALERWRRESIDALVALVVEPEGRELSDRQVAQIVHSLGDIRVRDTLLWHLVRCADRHAPFEVLVTALRGAPAGRVAPIATCTSICAWLLGDGARALVALDRAQVDDGEYSLAHLVARGLAAGLPPAFWTAAMAEVTEEQCRIG